MPIGGCATFLSVVESAVAEALDRIEGVMAIVISDKDGVTVVKATHPTISDASSSLLSYEFLSSYTLALDQTNKLPSGGEPKAIYAFHEQNEIAQFVFGSYYITFLAKENSNYGIFQTVATELHDSYSQTIESLIQSVAASSRATIS